MAKAVRTPPRPPRGPVSAPRPEKGGNYFAEVIAELRKVVWPTWDELRRMTGVVIVTVVLLAGIIGLADLLLSIAVKQIYVQSGTTTLGNFQNKTATTSVTHSASSTSRATTSTGSASITTSATSSASASTSTH